MKENNQEGGECVAHSLYPSQKRSEESSFIVREIASIIKTAIKKQQTKTKLTTDLQLYAKTKGDNSLLQSSDKLQNYRQKNREIEKSQLEAYLKKEKMEQEKTKDLLAKKQEKLQNLKKAHDEQLHKVRSNYFKNYSTQNNFSLQKFPGSHNVQGYRPPTSASRINFRHKLSKRIANFMNRKNQSEMEKSQVAKLSKEKQVEEDQQSQINKFLSKMTNFDERQIEKQMQCLSASKAKGSKYSCFVKIREERQIARMEKLEQLLHEKMSNFQQKSEQLKIEKENMSLTLTEGKGMRRNKNDPKEKPVSDRSKSVMSQNKSQCSQSRINEMDSYRMALMRSRNLEKIKHEKKMINQEKAMRALYQQMNKLKRMGDNEVLSIKEKQDILKYFKKNSNEYLEIEAFLATTKEVFIQQRIEDEANKKKKSKARKLL